MESELEQKADPRTEDPDICGDEYVGATGITWICVKQVHSKVYKRKNRYGYVFSSGSDNHYYINKYPKDEDGLSTNSSTQSLSENHVD